ncbi:substrate-binding domain-containing protein [Streptomyces himalayensis]|uniref:Substrate-binding domain-containing protein n=1 Tax=Streptomyces himalayensis subsp. himalayensis TaxID=2756131 RepID=A0A7W0DUM1_9ACTN|nr:substrate-binding domain-containing protein [Streptomyces himalayensis]MBA2951537.1 substrate-binding domain-containing protein [Streptomyces himalayensis subsp. himalayensis]
MEGARKRRRPTRHGHDTSLRARKRTPDDRVLGSVGELAYVRPALTTVAVDRERQGREAVRRLLAVLRGEPSSGRSRRPNVGTAA